MASRHRILCTTKTAFGEPYEKITHIGGLNSDSSRWKLTLSDAILGIESGMWEFYVSEGGVTASVVISMSPKGNKYLKTVNDGLSPNNLLSLVNCP